VLVAAAVMPSIAHADVGPDIGFRSPDGQLRCWFTGQFPDGSAPPARGVQCFRASGRWRPQTVDCQDTSWLELVKITPGRKRGRREQFCTGGQPWCVGEVCTTQPRQWPHLRVGHAIRSNRMTCTAINRRTIKCQNSRRHGFSASKAKYRLF
jgi:hypothetical protein